MAPKHLTSLTALKKSLRVLLVRQGVRMLYGGNRGREGRQESEGDCGESWVKKLGLQILFIPSEFELELCHF